MSSQSGGITSVECPECSDHVGISLPISADIASIVACRQGEEHDVKETVIDRPRKHQTSCVNDHLLSVLYDW
jgi:fructose-1,6-bisphosphatase/sedoheptulose 1,7-bisphosphatase-like protein